MAESIPASAEAPSVKPRRPWLAALLSLIAVGLGQVYNGKWRKGAGFLVAELVLALSMISLLGNFTSLVLFFTLLAGFSVFVAVEAFATAKGLKRFVPGRANRWWVYVLFLAGGILLGTVFENVVKRGFYRTYKTPTESMAPAIRPGDRFMVEILDRDALIERGDILVFRVPDKGDKDFVKRVVGLPGETVTIRDKVVTVDGLPLEEPYARHGDLVRVPQRDDFGPLTLPQGSYFMMGDNREKSFDSRFMGPIGRELIKGRALYIYFPGDAGDGAWADRLGLELR